MPAATPSRLFSLDVFRGMTIAAMILVNNPGAWSAVYWPLGHAPWHGWTPTDLIFPFFLFIMGVSMAFSFTSRTARGATRGALTLHVLRRSAIIFALGLFLAGYPYFDVSKIRIPGVLPRIAVCYLFAGIVVLWTWRRGRIASRSVSFIVVALLVGYWALMTFVPVPGYGAGRLDPEGNLAAYLDRKLLGGHLWSQSKTWDPEGPLSTLPAIATTLIGALIGEWLRSPRSGSGPVSRAAQRNVAGLLAMGAAGLVAGKLLHPFFPINKNLWTSTYVIFTAGFAMILLGLCYWVVDIRGYRRWSAPFLVFGTNAILSFALSTWVAKCSILFKVGVAGPAGATRMVTWHKYVYDRFIVPLASPVNASLLFAIAYVLLWLALMYPLYRRRIFIKI